MILCCVLIVVEDELVKIVRSLAPPTASTATTAFGGNNSSVGSNEFTYQVLSGVRFAPLVSYPVIKVFIPARVWNPR